MSIDTLFDFCKKGNLQGVHSWLETGGPYNPAAMDMVATNGYMELPNHFHTIVKDSSTDATDWASRNGRIELVMSLHRIGKGCTCNAIDWAASYGHLNVVEYLHS